MSRVVGIDIGSATIRAVTAGPGQSPSVLPTDALPGATWKWILDDPTQATAGIERVVTLLREVFAIAAKVDGEAPLFGIVAVPSLLGDAGAEAIRMAAMAAGLVVQRVVPDSVALLHAAVARGVRGRVLALDGGAAHTELSLAEITDGSFTFRAHCADRKCLGAPFDAARHQRHVARMLDAVLKQTQHSVNEIAQVLVTGGHAQEQAVMRWLRGKFFTRAVLYPPEAVAQGASLLGASLLQGTRGVQVLPPAERLVVEPTSEHIAVADSAPPRRESIPSLPGIPAVGGDMPRFRGVRGFDALLAEPVVHDVPAEDRAPPSLLILLVDAALQAEADDELSLSRDEQHTVIRLSRGRPLMTATERRDARGAFLWRDGQYAFRPSAHGAPRDASPEPLARLLGTAVRDMLRECPGDEVELGLAPWMPLAPSVSPARAAWLEPLGLSRDQSETVRAALDGARDLRELLHDGVLGRASLPRLVAMLEVFGALSWAPPRNATVREPREELARRREILPGLEPHALLGLHWTATSFEMLDAWTRFSLQYGRGGRWHSVDAVISAEILGAASRLWDRVSDDTRRRAYLRERHPWITPARDAEARACRVRRGHRVELSPHAPRVRALFGGL